MYNVISRTDETSTKIIENIMPLKEEDAIKFSKKVKERFPHRIVTVEEDKIGTD